MSLTISISGATNLQRQLQALCLSRADRLRYHRYLGREAVKLIKRRLRQQRDLAGRSFAPRAKGKGKLLRRIMRQVQITVNHNQATVGWGIRRTGQIARAQQEGISETVTARALQARNNQGDAGQATRSQARALLNAGYRKPHGGRVSQRWIMDHMTQKQAGLILHLLRDEPDGRKGQWTIDLPARSFLGLTLEERRQVGQQVLNRMQQAARHRR
jgi:5-methylcytosine-specific restriction endonuclease McrA